MADVFCCSFCNKGHAVLRTINKNEKGGTMFSTVMGMILANILFLALHLESRILPDPLTPKQEREEFEKY